MSTWNRSDALALSRSELNELLFSPVGTEANGDPKRGLGVKAPPPPPMTCDQLRQVKIPALITYGGDTRPFYRIAAERAAGCIPGAQLVAIQGGRHLAIVQQPDAFNTVLLQFLAKAASQPEP